MISISGLFFISATLFILIAAFLYTIARSHNIASQVFKDLTIMMKPGVVHQFKPVSYRLVYLFLIMYIIFISFGIYYWD